MDEIFVETKELGQLYISDVLIEYIFPRVFICRDEFGLRYLFSSILNEDNHDIWIVVKITNYQYYDLIDGNISIQSCYKKAKPYNIFCVDNKTENNERNVISFACTTNEINKLPKKEVFIKDRIFINETNDATLQAARETDLLTFDFKFYEGTNRHYLPYTIFSEIATSFPKLIKKIFNCNNINEILLGTAPGSCIVRFALDNKINLLDNDNKAEIKTLYNLLSAKSFKDIDTNLSSNYDFRKKYLDFLNAIKKTNSNMQFSSAFPESKESTILSFKSSQISEKYDELKKDSETIIEQINTEGELISLNAKSFKFILKCKNGNISGKFKKQLIQNRSYEVPKFYKIISLEKITKYNCDKVTKITYELIDLNV